MTRYTTPNFWLGPFLVGFVVGVFATLSALLLALYS